MKNIYLASILALSVVGLSIYAGNHITAAAAATDHPALTGTVHGPDGSTMEGVAISARSANLTFTTTVYTDEKGEYVFPGLAGGSYKVWAQAEGFTTDKAEITLDEAHSASQNFSLKTLDNFESQLTGSEWLAALPEDTDAHKRMKQVLYVSCSGCHGLDVVLNNKFDEDGWRYIVKSMESADYRGYRGADDMPAQNLGWEGQIIRHHRDELAKYLAEMRGPGPSPMKLKPFPRPTGEAARAVITQYDLPNGDVENEPARYNGGDWMLGETTGMHGEVGLHDVVADNQGMAWITQSRENFETNRQLIKLNPKTGQMTVLNVRNANGALINFEQITQPDLHGYIWMHGGGNFEALDTKTGTMTAYPIPRVYGGTENSIDPDSKGRVWANGRSGVVELDTSELNKQGVMYPGWHYYQQITPGNGTTYGMSVDADDNPWWSESYSDIVATKDMKTGKVTEFKMQDPGFEARKALFKQDLEFYDSIGGGIWSGTSGTPLPYGEFPRRLAADKNGDTVWIPNWAETNIAEINIHTQKVTYHELPLPMHPYKTIVDKFHNVYTDTQVGDGMMKFNPSSQKWTYFQLPTHGCSSRHMSFDDNLNEAWVPCDQADTVDRVQFRTAEQIQALKGAAQK
jgi:streptogramin lyase/mono/diheme cytochrome c family protein